MANHNFSRVARDLAVEQSLDAAIEVDEVMHGKREDSPALSELVSLLIGSPAGVVPTKRELLSDARYTSLYHRAAGTSDGEFGSVKDLDGILDLLFQVNSAGLNNFSKKNLKFVQEFCLGLNRELVSEAFSRVPEPAFARSRQQKLATSYVN
jgi:hypothetical protein